MVCAQARLCRWPVCRDAPPLPFSGTHTSSLSRQPSLPCASVSSLLCWQKPAPPSGTRSTLVVSNSHHQRQRLGMRWVHARFRVSTAVILTARGAEVEFVSFSLKVLGKLTVAPNVIFADAQQHVSAERGAFRTRGSCAAPQQIRSSMDKPRLNGPTTGCGACIPNQSPHASPRQRRRNG